jgi:hypothetical protein
MEAIMEAIYYLDLSPMDYKGEPSDAFIEQLREVIRGVFPVKMDFRTNSERATLMIRHPRGQTEATLFRCPVINSRIIGNNLVITYRKQEEIGKHIYSRYYLQEREADIINGHSYQFILIDNVLLVEEITHQDKEITQDTIDADNTDLAGEEDAGRQNT